MPAATLQGYIGSLNFRDEFCVSRGAHIDAGWLKAAHPITHAVEDGAIYGGERDLTHSMERLL